MRLRPDAEGILGTARSRVTLTSVCVKHRNHNECKTTKARKDLGVIDGIV